MDAATIVYEALVAASTQDASRVTDAGGALQKVENEVPGAFNILYSIAAQRNLPVDLRLLAIVRVKTQGTSLWRRRSIFDNDQKQELRNAVFNFLDEPDERIAKSNAIIVAKIARSDYPNQWPNLFEQLLSILQTNWGLYFCPQPSPQAGLVLRRTLHVLYTVTKELVSKRTPDGAQTMRQVCAIWAQPLSDIYEQFAADTFDNLTSESIMHPLMPEKIRIGHLAFKSRSTMLCWLWTKVNNKDFADGLPAVEAFFQMLLNRTQRLYELRTTLAVAANSNPALLSSGYQTLARLTKHVKAFGSTARTLATGNTSKFVSLPGSTDLVLFYWDVLKQAASADPTLMSDEIHAVYPQHLIVQALILMKETLPQWSPTKKGVSPENVLSPQFVNDAMSVLLQRFLPLSTGDLQKWEEDSEEWLNESGVEEGGAWEHDVRPCAERLVIVLVSRYHATLCPMVCEEFNRINQGLATADLNAVRHAEAVYCAVGAALHHVKDQLDFESWVRNVALPVVQATNPAFRLLKRRIAWLIGKWMHEIGPLLKNPHVWQVMHHLLQDHGDSSDLAVRITAAHGLQLCTDSLDTPAKEALFRPFISGYIVELLNLLVEAEATPSRKRVATTLSAIVSVAGPDIIPQATLILAPLSQLWANDTAKDATLKISILELINTLVASSREQSALLVSAVVPLVQESMTPPLSVQLDAEALPLWQSALRHADGLQVPPGSVSLLALLPLAVKLLGENLDLLGSLLNIMKSYILLDASQVFQTCGRELCRSVFSLLPQAVAVNAKDAIIVLNMTVQACPPQIWAGAMHESGLFGYLLKELIDEKTKLQRVVLVEIVLLICRMLLADPTVFTQLMSATSGPEWDRQETRLYEGLLDQFWNKFDSMAHPQPRKLLAMGFAVFVTTGRPEVLSRLSTEISNAWVDVMVEVREASNEDEENPLTAYWRTSEQEVTIEADVEGTPEEARVRQLASRDPIHTIKLTTFIREQLARTEQALGGPPALQQYLAGDKDVYSSLMKELAEA